MRFFLRLVVLLIVILIAVGFYRHWFSVSGPAQNATDGKVDVNASVDMNKVKSDVKKVEERVKKVKEKVSGELQKHGKPGDKDSANPSGS